MLRLIAALALVVGFMFFTFAPASANESNPIFGHAVVKPMTETENAKVTGKGYYADLYGYYGVLYSYYAYSYGVAGYNYKNYNYYFNASDYASTAASFYYYAGIYQYYGY